MLDCPWEHLAPETASLCGCVAIAVPSREGRTEQQHRHLLHPAYFPQLTVQHAQAPRAGTLPCQRPVS